MFPHLQGATILNGIRRHGLGFRDLQSRVVAIKLEDRSQTKSDSQLWRHFESIRPFVKASIFEILSRAMATLRKINAQPRSRFGDFERWGLAITEVLREAGLPYSPKDFIEAYVTNLEETTYRVLDDNPLAKCLLSLRDRVTDEMGRYAN